MADNTNPPQQSRGTIDLRQQSSVGASTATAAATGSAPIAQNVLDKFEIPETVKNQYPDLIPLILETESMNDDERQYWFQILPIMTDEQVQKLREILVNEKNQLKKLDKDYEQELKRINQKHVSQWKAFEAKEKREKLATLEGKAEVQEKTAEEELLKKLQNL